MYNFNSNMALSEIYEPAMKITTKSEAEIFLNELSNFIAGNQLSLYNYALEVAKENIAYYAGYYDIETRIRVEDLFKCEHPVMKKAAHYTYTNEELFAMGQEWARKELNKSEN